MVGEKITKKIPKKITKTLVDELKAGAANVFHWDAGDDKTVVKGFGVKVTPTGAKTYLFQYRMGGRGTTTRRYTIGRHGSLAPDQARKIAKDLARDVAAGVDPIEAKKERARAAAAEKERAADLAFEVIADRFLAAPGKRPRKASYLKFRQSIMRNHVTPRLRGRSIDAIELEDLIGVLDALPAAEIALRRNVFVIIRAFFRWAKARTLIERSPLEGFDDAPGLAPSRDHVLTDAELGLAWEASIGLGMPFGPYFRILIGTGQRREEVAGLDWRELDRARAEWVLPAERSKNGEPNTVHLSGAMIAELDSLAGLNADSAERKWPKRGLVLTTTGKTPISGYSRAKRRLDAAMVKAARAAAEKAGEDPDDVELAPWRVHDLRRTVATGLQRLGVRFEVTEAVLNHASGRSRSGVAAVYQRHGWTDEKRAALDLWGQHLTLIRAGLDVKSGGALVASLVRAMAQLEHRESNVVPLRRGK